MSFCLSGSSVSSCFSDGHPESAALLRSLRVGRHPPAARPLQALAWFLLRSATARGAMLFAKHSRFLVFFACSLKERNAFYFISERLCSLEVGPDVLTTVINILFTTEYLYCHMGWSSSGLQSSKTASLALKSPNT